MGTRWNRLIMSYSGLFFRACQGVDCTFRWKGLIGNDNLLREGICPPTRPGCLSASSATISTGRLADRSCCQRPQARACSRINPALVSLSPASKTRQRIKKKKKSPAYNNQERSAMFTQTTPALSCTRWNKSERKSWEGERAQRRKRRAQMLCSHRSSTATSRTSKRLEYFSFLGLQTCRMMWHVHNSPSVSFWPSLQCWHE